MRVNQKLMGFAAGTKVLMADGSERTIENIKTGDLVLSFDQLDAFGALEPKRVLNTFKRIDRNPLKVKVVGSDDELTVAPGQLFINPGSDWKDAVNINEIIDGDGNVHKFNVSQITRGKYQMYDIIVEDNHSLIANGVRVHNMTYSIADVIAGRNLAGSDIQSGSISNYYRTGDYDNNSDMHQEGRSKKKKSKRRTSKPEPRIDGLQAGAKLLSSIEDLVEVVGEIVDNTSPTNLTVLKAVVQQSVDSIVNYLASFGASILNATMNAYDKSEILIMTADMTQAAVAMRKPFEETVVSASGKLLAQTQLKLFDLQIARMNNILEIYLGAAEEDRDSFDVERNGERTRGSKSRRNSNNRGSDGRYNEGGGSRGGGNTQPGSRSGGGPAPAKNTKPGGAGTKPRPDIKAPAKSAQSARDPKEANAESAARSRAAAQSSGPAAARERAAGDRAAASNAAATKARVDRDKANAASPRGGGDRGSQASAGYRNV